MINRDDLQGMAPGFIDWLEEVEVYNTRYERLCSTFAELDAHAWKDLMLWLHTAYTMGVKNHVELQHGRGTQG